MRIFLPIIFCSMLLLAKCLPSHVKSISNKKSYFSYLKSILFYFVYSFFDTNSSRLSISFSSFFKYYCPILVLLVFFSTSLSLTLVHHAYPPSPDFSSCQNSLCPVFIFHVERNRRCELGFLISREFLVVDF